MSLNKFIDDYDLYLEWWWQRGLAFRNYFPRPIRSMYKQYGIGPYFLDNVYDWEDVYDWDKALAHYPEGVRKEIFKKYYETLEKIVQDYVNFVKQKWKELNGNDELIAI
ncbi:MAG: hypothetical protein QXU26_03550 [Thermofilaceae archaeon]